MERTNVAMFIDYENIHLSLSKQNKQLDPDKLDIFRTLAQQLQRAKEEIMVIASWANLGIEEKRFREMCYKVESPPNANKNASDIKLVVEVMDYVFKNEVDTVVLFSGDGDFLSLIQYLITNGKEVILYSVKGSESSEIVKVLGESNHLFIQEKFPSHVIDKIALPHNYENVLISIHRGIKRMGFQGRKQLIDFITTRRDIYGPLNMDEAGILLDNMITERYILEDNTHPSVRKLKINYDHYEVQNIQQIK